MDRVDEILFLYEDDVVEMADGGRVPFQLGANEAMRRGAMRFSESGKKRNPRVKEMTEAERRKQNAQKTFRKKGLGSATEKNPKFVEFLKNYKTREEQILERGQERAKKNAAKNKAMRLEEIVKVEPGKMTFNQRTKLLNSYHDFFEQAYKEAVDAGGLFNRADISRAVIKKIEETYPAQADNMDFFPGRTKNPDHIGYYEYIDREQKGTAKFRKTNNLKQRIGKNISNTFSTAAAGARQTKQQENIFKLLSEGVNEIDDIATRLGYSRAQVTRETEKLLNNMFVRTNEKPTFLKGKEIFYNDIIDSLEDSKSMGDFHKRNMKSLVYATFPQDKFPQENKLALQKIKEFDAFKKKIQADYPGVKIAYDHPASYQALKNLDFKNYLNVTPIAEDINTLKSRFDLESIRNLDNLKETYSAQGPRSLEYKTALKKQRDLEKLWSDLTGGKSSLGKIRINRQLTGTTGLENPGKNLQQEYLDNLSIRENIKQNLTPELEKRMTDMFPTKRGQTASVARAKEIAMSDLGDLEKKIFKRLAVVGCPGKAKGGRVEFNLGGSTQCITKGLEKLNNPDKLSPGDKANVRAMKQLTKGAKGARAMGSIAKLGAAVGIGSELALSGFFALTDYGTGKNKEEILSNFTYGLAGRSQEEQLQDKDKMYGAGEKAISTTKALLNMSKRPEYGRMGASTARFSKAAEEARKAQEPFVKTNETGEEFIDVDMVYDQIAKDQKAREQYKADQDKRKEERTSMFDDAMVMGLDEFAGGGIAGIRKPDAIPPESGPNPQGLENLKYYVTNT